MDNRLLSATVKKLYTFADVHDATLTIERDANLDQFVAFLRDKKTKERLGLKTEKGIYDSVIFEHVSGVDRSPVVAICRLAEKVESHDFQLVVRRKR
ncbi:MAG: hypothetical protein AAB897_01015 [Patescibacteria group bacterium]